MAEFAFGGSFRSLYSELTNPWGPILKCLKQLPYAASRTIWYSTTLVPGTNRYSLVMNY